MRVHRYALGITDHQVLDLPLSSQLLSVAPGRHYEDASRRDIPRPMAEHIDLWALVPEVAPAVPYDLHIVGTGNPMPPQLTRHGIPSVAAMFVGTCVMPSGLVWHVFYDEMGSR
jgi:hypothetical protein